jgi:type IX secretion system PorP/SprF family membrane protein
MKVRIFIYIFFYVCTVNIYAQDPQFSQFYANPLYLAPSFAGAVEGSRITANYRNQWITLVPFITYNIGYDQYFSDFKSGVGIICMKDVIGKSELGTFRASLLYSYNFEVYHTVNIRPGLGFSYIDHGVHNYDLNSIFDILGEPSQGSIYDSDKARNVDVSTSLLVYTKNMWFGTTFDHIIKPDLSLSTLEARLPVKFSLFGGIELIEKGKLLKPKDETMTFTFLFKNQGKQNQLDLGIYWYKVPLVLGIWYRGLPPFNSQRGDAFVLLAGYKTRHFNIGYSFDLTISNLISHAYATHEVSMSVKFRLPRRRKKITSIPCPEF